ncbi:MAG TPA: twin-arginine translocation signal domain-containing protein [Candidatus Hydrogenedentes bacterium]|nr:twin-arginine translocation signal domain-containing protein [Candidatus Hydrogenedentota bacterium]
MAAKKMDRRGFLKTTGGALALGVTGIRPWAAGAEESADPMAFSEAVLQVKDPTRIKLLQFTDMHFFNFARGRDRNEDTASALLRLVEINAPDMIAVTGDLWHDNPKGRGEEYMRYAIDKLEALGMPWFFTWGNHDLLDDYDKGHEAFTHAKHSLYRGAAGNGNYLVRCVNSAGAPVWDFICLNTTRLGVHEEQKQWLRELRRAREGMNAIPPAFAVFHIPIKQYDDIWEQKIASGVKLEKVCLEEEDGTALGILKELGTVRAVICGHDHVNDYSGICEGIDLIYGRATGYGGYGEREVPKGAKMYAINAETGTYSWWSVTPEGKRWRPAPGVRYDKREDVRWDYVDDAEPS